MSRFDTFTGWTLAPALLYTHGESVVYRGRTTSDTTITAIIDRNPLDVLTGGRCEYTVEIAVSKSDVPAPVVNSDRVQLTKRLGDAVATWFTVTHLVDQDGGLWRLGLT